MITRQFLTAGKAIFTIQNNKDEHFTFRVTRSKPKSLADHKPPVYFVSVMTGRDNESSYSYIGLLNTETGDLLRTRKSKLADTDVRLKVFAFAMRIVFGTQMMPAGYDVRHSGKCGRCGRLLTEPMSLDTGIGPECRKYLQVRSANGVNGNSLQPSLNLHQEIGMV